MPALLFHSIPHIYQDNKWNCASQIKRIRINQKYHPTQLWPACLIPTTKKYTQCQPTVTRKGEVSRTWPVTWRHTWRYVTSLRPNVYFITTKISKLSLVACVPHLLCWTHSTCSLCTAHLLLIFFVTTFTHYLTIYLPVIFTYVVPVQIPNWQNIHKWELWTCDNNEQTHHLRSK